MTGEKEVDSLAKQVDQLKVGTPVFEIRPRQELNDDGLNLISTTLEAEQVPLYRHPELGPGLGFRLNREPSIGKVTQVDIYLGRSIGKNAAVRIHRLDDFGEPFAPRYRFSTGYLLEGETSGIAFHNKSRNRIVTVFKDGTFDEAASQPRVVADFTSEAEKALALLPPVLSVVEVTKLLNISRAAVYGAIDRGRIAAVKVDDRWEIDTESFLLYQKSTSHRRGKPGPHKFQDESIWLTMEEAIAIMDISWTYAKKLINEGKLQATRRGKMWFIDPTSAASFQRERKKSSKLDLSD